MPILFLTASLILPPAALALKPTETKEGAGLEELNKVLRAFASGNPAGQASFSSIPPNLFAAGVEEDVGPERAKELLQLLLRETGKPVRVVLLDFPTAGAFSSGENATTVHPNNEGEVRVVEEFLNSLPGGTRLRWEPGQTSGDALQLVLRYRFQPSPPVPAPKEETKRAEVEKFAVTRVDEPSEAVTKALPVRVRWMIRRDMPEVLQIEGGIVRPLGGNGWEEEDFLRNLRERNVIGLVAERGEKVLGYTVYALRKGSVHLLNIAVHPEYRRQGIGKAMIDKVKSTLSSYRRTRMDVIVRESDLDALLFFKAQGFVGQHLLKEYFDDTKEDAIEMSYLVPQDLETDEKSAGLEELGSVMTVEEFATAHPEQARLVRDGDTGVAVFTPSLFHVYSDGTLSTPVHQQIAVNPVEGVSFDVQADLREQERTASDFHVPGIILADAGLGKPTLPGAAALRIVTLYRQEAEALKPTAWIVLAINRNLTVEQILSMNLRLEFFPDRQGNVRAAIFMSA